MEIDANAQFGHQFDLGLEIVKQYLTTTVSGMSSGWRHANAHSFFSLRKPAFAAPIVLHVSIAFAHPYFRQSQVKFLDVRIVLERRRGTI